MATASSSDPGHDPGHGHSHDHAPAVTDDNRRLLWRVLLLNAGFLLVEAVGGVAFGSLALLADATHMVSDVAGLAIALIAQSLLRRPPSDRHTFGLLRSEVLAAQANGVLLVATGGWILFEAIRRLGSPPEIDGGWVTAIALVGLAINLVSARMLFAARDENLNMRGAFLHMLADAAGSVAAVVAGLAAVLGGQYWVDPVVSLVIAVLVGGSAWVLLRRATHVLLEGAPGHLDADDIVAAVVADPDVADLHHLHLWHLGSDSVAASGHIVVEDEPTLHQAQAIGDRVRSMLDERFGITHATLELECHACEPADGVTHPHV